MLCIHISLYVICVYLRLVNSEIARSTENTKVRVNKCCEPNEIYLGRYCTAINKTSEEWRPLFTSENGNANLQVEYRYTSKTVLKLQRR